MQHLFSVIIISLLSMNTLFAQDMITDHEGNTIHIANIYPDYDEYKASPNAIIWSAWSEDGNTSVIIKKDKDGNILWERNIGATSGLWAYNLVVDKKDNIYFLATFYGAIDLEPYGKSLVAHPYTAEGNPCIIKISPEGEVLLAKQLENNQEAYRVNSGVYDTKTATLTVEVDIRSDGGQDMPHTVRTYTLDSENLEVKTVKDEAGLGW